MEIGVVSNLNQVLSLKLWSSHLSFPKKRKSIWLMVTFESLCDFVRYFLFAFFISATHVLSETKLSPSLFFSSLEFRLPTSALRDSD